MHDENVEYLKTKKLSIEMLGKNAQPFRINPLDGEYGGDTPVELSLLEAAHENDATWFVPEVTVGACHP